MKAETERLINLGTNEVQKALLLQSAMRKLRARQPVPARP